MGGKIAQMGQRLIDGVARSMAEDFFRRFDEEMQRRHPEAYAAAAAAQPRGEPTCGAGRQADSCMAVDRGRRVVAGCALCGGCARDDMENLDVMVLRSLRDWRLAGKRALLATVVRTWGSSPRPIGSIMALVRGRRGGRIGLGRLYRGRPHLPLHRQRRAGKPDPDGRSRLREIRHHRGRGAPLRSALRRNAGTAAGVRPGRLRARRTRGRAGAGAPDAAHGQARRRLRRRWTKRRRPAH